MKNLGIIGVVFGVFAAAAVVTLSILYPNNYAETSEDTADDALKTRHYFVQRKFAAEKDDVEEIRRLVAEIELVLARQTTYGRGWRVISSAVADNSASFNVEVPVVVFTDDLSVKVNFHPAVGSDLSKMEVIVNARSAARVGKGDLGENHRHVKQFLKQLDSVFGNEKL